MSEKIEKPKDITKDDYNQLANGKNGLNHT